MNRQLRHLILFWHNICSKAKEMKRIFFRIGFYLSAIVLLSSCGSMNNLRLNVFEPAFINVPDSIKNVGMINRYMGQRDKKAINIVEGILTGEGIGGDKQGSIAALKELGYMMSNSGRYNVKELPDKVVKGVGPEGMPAPIDLSVLDSLALVYQVDGFVVLENFDSDINRHISPSPNPIVLPIGISIPGIRIHMKVFANSHWRFYDMQSRSILDQFSSQSFVSYNADAVSELLASGKLPMAKDAVGKAGQLAGNDYSLRIVDHYIWVGRSYYKGGSNEMKHAARMVRVKDWDGASIIWKKQLEIGRPKVASRALYNLALYYEVKGNLNAAIQSAEECYKRYNDKKSLRYFQILKDRQSMLTTRL